jgi:chromosomal replication initiation ATPase DnaA
VAHRRDRYYTWLKIRLDERDRPVTLDELAGVLAESHQVDVAGMKSRARSRRLSEARRVFLLLALEHRIASLSDVARFLNRSPSTLHEILETARKAHRSGTDTVSLEEILKGPTAPAMGAKKK